MKIVQRNVDRRAVTALVGAGIPDFLARIYAARGVRQAEELGSSLNRLMRPESMKNIEVTAKFLAESIQNGRAMTIVADYDCDGATACAVALRGLREFGARVDYIVPNRFEYGYGLTPEIVRMAHQRHAPDILITVDNGIASVEGVEQARQLGIEVVITDHHLPAEHLPASSYIVNPNQPGCNFSSKNLAGVGVMFYLLLAMRAHLRDAGIFTADKQPRLDHLLDLVALGTVADVVRLDANNRVLVEQGLQRIRSGRMQPGIAALFRVAGRDPRRAAAADLGFAIGPRINAAGRLADMSLGIECLTTDDNDRALSIAQQLDSMNRQRRDLETTMQDSALRAIEEIALGAHPSDKATLCMFDPSWHQGVVGILASRLRERFHRPTVAFALAQDGTLRGSGRSIPGLHLRDALDLVSKRAPGLIHKFGGHASAAGLTLDASSYPTFIGHFESIVRSIIDPAYLEQTIETDGSLEPAAMTLANVRFMDGIVWGQGFAPPLFCDEYTVISQRLVKDRHLKLALRRQGAPVIDAIWFNHVETLADKARVVYRLAEDSYNGQSRLQLIVEHAEPASPGQGQAPL